VRKKEGFLVEETIEGREFIIGYDYLQGFQEILNLDLGFLTLGDTEKVFTPINELKQAIRTPTFGLAAILLILALAVSRRLTMPVSTISTVAKKAAEGDFDQKITDVPKDEFGFLAKAVNQMTENLRSQSQQLADRNFLDSVIENMQESLVMADTKGVVRRANDATLKLLGYKKEEELVGQPLGKILEMRGGEKNIFEGSVFEGLLREGFISGREVNYITSHEKKIPMSFSVSLVHGSDGGAQNKKNGNAAERSHDRKTESIICVARDASEAKRLVRSLEDSKKDLEKTNVNLERTKNEMEKTLEDLEGSVKERASELAVLYEVSNAISYTLDQQQLLKLVMEALFKIVDYDICASILFDEKTADILLKPSYPQSLKYTDEVTGSLIKSVSAFSNQDISAREVNTVVLPVDPNMQPRGLKQFKGLKSSFNAPLLVGGEIIGMINISGSEENVFLENEIKFIYTIANQVSSAIERLQTMISAEKSKMESMVESMLEGAIMLDDKGDILVLNPRARDMMGLNTTGDVENSALHAQMGTVNLDEAIEECLQKDGIVTREVTMPHNERQVLRCDISPVRSGEEKVGTAIILRDITKEKEIDTMKTEFISTVSHELRTPLSITKEGLSLVLDKIAGDITEKQKVILSTAQENIDRLARLINNLLDVSKIEAGKMETKKEQLNVPELAGQVISTFETKAKERGLELRTRFEDKTIEIFADRDKTIQVFTNLINNALKFTATGHIEVSGKEDGDFVECAVADTGIGISKEDLARTFTKFQQFGRNPGAGEKGTGLGLTIAKGIVEMHDGEIWVESELGKGTQFIFTMPKFSPELPLREFVRDGVKEAQKSNARMSLVTMALLDNKNSKKALSKEKKTACLESVGNVIRQNLHRQGDGVFQDFRRCYVILANCDKDHIGHVCDRLAKSVQDHLDEQKLAGAFTLETGYATYPDDARNSSGLLKKARGL